MRFLTAFELAFFDLRSNLRENEGEISHFVRNDGRLWLKRTEKLGGRKNRPLISMVYSVMKGYSGLPMVFGLCNFDY